MNVTLIDLMRQAFARMGHKRAITFVRNGRFETGLSFDELDRDSDALARRFVEGDLRKGDRTIILLPKCVHWIVAYIAIMKIGAICVPLNPGLKKDELEYLFGEIEPGLVVAGTDQEEVVEHIAPKIHRYRVNPQKPYHCPSHRQDAARFHLSEDIGLHDLALIVYTSGTTGRPKGAVLTQGNLSYDAQNIVTIWEITQSDTLCHALPLFHVHGLCFGLHTSLVAGATTLITETFDPTVILNILADKNTTVFMAVPTMYSKLIDHHPKMKIDYSHLRLLTSGSAPLLEKDFERIRKIFGIEPVEREGMSETLMNFSNPLHGRRKPGSIGLPLPHLEVRIVDPETFLDVQHGDTGEIWLKSPAITSEYWRKPMETARVFENGWFRTGDLGRQDEDGYYYLTDRLKNIIISGGENISPKEVEIVINSHDDVIESAVVGIPDTNWGEMVVAAVVLRQGASLTHEEIIAHCKELLSNWKCPKKIVVVPELPKNRMGKLLRSEVRKLFL